MATRSLSRRVDAAEGPARLLPWPDFGRLRRAVEAERPAPDPSADPVGFVRHAYAAEHLVALRGMAHTRRPDYVFDAELEAFVTRAQSRALDLLDAWARLDRQPAAGRGHLDALLDGRGPGRGGGGGRGRTATDARGCPEPRRPITPPDAP